ncbi:meiosis-specific protein ASY3-like [Gossypium arboreum]|uniref:Meiosis-specific protein ASY3-like coiled-coil domain-containing protein n=1 Tax=Gossypium arboreum TaxID=29729 RepID=A0ABR0PCI0_GOSAR|nr:meiosis-specific protein ASY3-like [Gossypium arboreum]KAK5818819.1 hypothetical protein PVK06_023765 [Gossypium arboreum]
MSDYRSLGSNFHSSSQSRKISIGVILDSLVERKLGDIKEDECKQSNTERIKPDNGIYAEGKNKGEAATTPKRKQTEHAEQVKSPWITPRKSLAARTASSNLGQKKHKKAKDVSVTYSVQFFSNKTFNAQNARSKQNSFDSFIDDLTYKRKERNDGNSQKVEFNLADAGKVPESDKLVLESKANKTQNKPTETLKMKLQELLGNVSSPESQLSRSQDQEADANNLTPQISVDHMGHTVVKPRQSSDTIETDSENPDQIIKRPVTNSLTRKRAPAKVQTNKTKVGLSSKQKHRERFVSFREGRSTKLDGAVNTASKLSRKKKIQKKSSKIDSRKICFAEEGNVDEIKQTSYRSETPVPAGKTSVLGNKMENSLSFFSEKRRENFERVQENHFFSSPVTNKNQPANFENPTSPEKGDKQEDFGNISLWNVVNTQDNFPSPTFGFRTPILNTSPSPTPKTMEREQVVCSPVPSERGFITGNIRSFRNFQVSRPVCNKSTAQAHSPVSLTIFQDSDMGIEHVKRYAHSKPSSEERLSESFEDFSPTIKRYNCHTENPISLDTGVFEKPNFNRCPIKRISECTPTTASQKGARIGESVRFHEPLEQDQEDELTRAVTLFASALETFKRKMDSTTSKKSSEILVSISEEINSLLLNAQSEIEYDVGKLTSLNKTKKKRLETRLQEQQEQLKLILQNFKEDIHQLLLDCNSILEGMEAHQIELKGIMKKQKVSHQKLLMDVKAAAEIQLNNAERRITSVHESAREKMLQLKHVIAECLTDSKY